MFFGGAKGGGKTDGLLMYGFNVCQQPGARVLMLRRTYADLRRGGAAIDRSQTLFTGLAKWNGSDYKWTFPNGSTFEFGHLQHATSHYQYQGAQYDAVLWDELTQFLSDQYDYIWGSVRSPRGYKTAFRATGNPGGIGHSWVKQRFIDAAPWGESFAMFNDDHEEIGQGRFIPAKLEDNPALTSADPTYERRLRAMPKKLRQALADGDWDVFDGQVFDWSRDRHVLKPFSIPADWERRTGMDWGVHRPFVCEWAAYGTRRETDPKPKASCSVTHIYLYQEFAAAGLRDETMAQAVAERSRGQTIRAHMADPNSFWLKNNQTGQSPSMIFARAGIALTPANNDRIMGKRAMETALADCACGVPQLRVFETCPSFIASIPSLPYDPFNVEDVDTSAALDDPYDAGRYLLMGPRQSAPQRGTRTATGLRA